MKKIYLILSLLISTLGSVFSQANLQVIAPVGNGATTQNRAPNGNVSHATLRGCFFVSQAELTSLVTGTNVTSLGFTLTTGVSGSAVTGSMTLYLQNTSDPSYQKGTNWTTAITGMSTVYNGNMTIPVSVGTTSINLILAPGFNYTGGGIYVAYDWACNGPYSAGFATYAADNTLPVGGASASTTIAPATTTLGATNFRPCFIFGAVNSATNDVQVTGVIASGKVAGSFNAPQTVSAIIKNGSNAALSSVSVALNIGGANTFSNTVVIPSMAAGATSTITFASYTPTIGGLNTISVSTLPDQNNANNMSVYNQSITCSTWAQNQPNPVFTNAVGFNTASGIISSRYINPITSTLNAVAMAIGNTASNAGNAVYGVLMNSVGNIVATTNTITLTAAMFNTLQTFSFTTAQVLTAGTYYIGMAQPANTTSGYFPLAASPAIFVPTTIYYTSILTGSFPSNLTQNLGYFDIEGIFAHTTTISATSPSSIVCNGASITLSGNGATTYTWSTGATTQTISVSPTVATTYSVVGTNSMGCLANASVSLAINPSPTVSAVASSSAVCPGATVNLTAGGADTYSWSTGSSSTVTAVNPTVATTYTVVGTSTIGCSSAATVAIAMNIPTLSITGPTAVCAGNQGVLSVSGANTFTWNTGFNTLNILVTPSVTTSYSVAGTNSAGCVGTQSINLVVNPNPVMTTTLSPTTICSGESATLSAGGTTSYTFYTNPGSATFSTSSPGVTGVVLSPTTSLTYTVIGANNFGCTKVVTVNLAVSACVGIHENAGLLNQISIFPNPNNGLFTVDLFDIDNLASIEVYSIFGSKIKTLKAFNGKNEIDLQDQANGVYFIYLTENNAAVSVLKVVKQ